MAFTVEMSPLSARWAELDVACRQGDLTTVDRLISEAEADGTEMLEGPLTTALLVAFFDGRVRVVERLLAAGADVEACYRGERALFLASKQGHVKVVETLLAAAAHLDAPNLDGWTPLCGVLRGSLGGGGEAGGGWGRHRARHREW